MRIAPFLCLCLLGCGAWPDAGGPPLSQSQGDWPELLPINGLLSTLPEAEATEADRLSSRAAALRRRAAILRADVSSREDMDRLRARLSR